MTSTNADLFLRRYLLRAYGLPRIEDEEHARERAAIERGLKHIQGAGHHFAEMRDQMNAKIVWIGYIDQAGQLKETYEREPGSDDA